MLSPSTGRTRLITMQVRKLYWATAFLTLLPSLQGQGTPPTPPARRMGGFIPGQQRVAGDPAQLERGKSVYGIGCRSCHGADLRGGDMGGPNLLRSQLCLSDKDGELIIPVIEGSRQSTGMPAIKMSSEDAKAVAAYVRSVLGTIGGQGMPPSVGKAAPSILVGNASEGQAYFAAKCSGCHSGTGDMQGIASRIADPKALQNAWVAGGARQRFGGPAQSNSRRRTVTVAVTLPSGAKEDGRLVRIDDFTVTLAREDGTTATFRRDGDIPKVEVRDPLKAHRDLLPGYTDKNIHDVTAYLVTLK
ncbi:MAG: c-type cytochrome [Acidobacteria bacterium]|nr:c-type cytochrome [Acidobacteriota bacterium]